MPIIDPGTLHIMRLAPWRTARTYPALLAILLACLASTNQPKGQFMTLYTITTDNRAVAITNDSEVVARLNGSDPVLRETARHLRRGGLPLWDGTAPFTLRPATPDECDRYQGWLDAGRAH
jgi:hypothetical protein